MSSLVGAPCEMYTIVDSIDITPFRRLADNPGINGAAQKTMSTLVERFQKTAEGLKKEVDAFREGPLTRIKNASQGSSVVQQNPEEQDVACRKAFAVREKFLSLINNREFLESNETCTPPEFEELGRTIWNFKRKELEKHGGISPRERTTMLNLGEKVCKLYGIYLHLVFCAKKIEFLTKTKSPEERAHAETELWGTAVQWLQEETSQMQGQAGTPTEIDAAEAPLPLVVAAAIGLENSLLVRRQLEGCVGDILKQTGRIDQDFQMLTQKVCYMTLASRT